MARRGRLSPLRALGLVAWLACLTSSAAAAPDAVTILRDAWGVPHLFVDGGDAARRSDYANGWAQAEDRLFQMDILRRAATGRLAALLGPAFLRMDEVVRRDAPAPAERAAMVRRLSARDRQALQDYVDGVNGFIARVTVDPGLRPREFGDTPPAPWTVDDSVAVAALEFTVEGANGGQEVLNADLLLDLLARFPEADARGIFDDLFWIDEAAAPTTIRTGHARDIDRPRRFAPAQVALVRRHADAIRAAAASLREEQGLMGGLGPRLALPLGVTRHASNAIVVGPSLSATGRPLLLGGPQTGLTIPSFFWEVGVHARGYEAEGVIAPAGPGVLIGRGRDFATTITSGIMDNVDTFLETIDPAHPDRYLFHGRSIPFERRVETIAVSGSPDVAYTVLGTRHGPVFFVDSAAGVAFSRRAAFRGRELDSAAAITSLGFARTLAQFRRLADRVAPSLNLHYADARGNIAYFHRGVRPLRPLRTDPRLPLDGSGPMEWRGVLAPARLPSVVNPKAGFITNWNNKPIRGWSAGEQRELWGVVDRVGVFVDALEARRRSRAKLTLDDVKALMRRAATSDIFASRVVPFLEDAVAGIDPAGPDGALAAAVARVRAWVDAGASLAAVPDPNGVVPDPGAAIYTAFRSAAQTAVFGDELGGGLRPMFYPAVNEGDQEDDHGSFGTPDALFVRVLYSAGPVPGAPTPAGLRPVSRRWFDDVATGTPGTRRDVLLAALRTALAALATRFGTVDQTRWQLPALREQYMDLGAISGVFGASVIERENRGSFNVVVDLGRPVAGEIIVPPGEAGTFTAADVGHEPPHLRDQLALYEAFVYRRQPFAASELEAPVTMETIAVPPRGATP